MAERLRLLIVHPALAPYRLDLFNALGERYRLRLLFLDRDVPYQSYDQAALRAALGPEHGFLDRGLTVAGRKLRLGLSAELRSFRPQVVVTHEFSPLSLAVVARRAAGRRIPHVVWTADNPEVVRAESPLRSLARRLVLPRIDGLVVYSDEMADRYRRRFRFARTIGVCPNAQSERGMRRRLEEALPLARGLALERGLLGRRLVLYVGRLARVKRLDRLLDAFAIARRADPRAVLALVGDGPERPGLEARAARPDLAGAVLFAGHLEGSALHAWYCCAAVFALTSEFEPWGAVVNEALLGGVPVVCSREAGARALLAPGHNGEVVDAADLSRLARALAAWSSRAEPLGPEQLEAIRPSRMLRGFEEAVDGFCSAVDAAAAGTGAA